MNLQTNLPWLFKKIAVTIGIVLPDYNLKLPVIKTSKNTTNSSCSRQKMPVEVLMDMVLEKEFV
jgi:hypothetical protein